MPKQHCFEQVIAMDEMLTKNRIENDWNLEDWNEKLWNLKGESFAFWSHKYEINI